MNGVSLDIETDAPENPLMWECAERSLRNRGDDYGEDDCRRWLATSPEPLEFSSPSISCCCLPRWL